MWGKVDVIHVVDVPMVEMIRGILRDRVMMQRMRMRRLMWMGGGDGSGDGSEYGSGDGGGDSGGDGGGDGSRKRRGEVGRDIRVVIRGAIDERGDKLGVVHERVCRGCGGIRLRGAGIEPLRGGFVRAMRSGMSLRRGRGRGRGSCGCLRVVGRRRMWRLRVREIVRRRTCVHHRLRERRSRRMRRRRRRVHHGRQHVLLRHGVVRHVWVRRVLMRRRRGSGRSVGHVWRVATGRRMWSWGRGART